MTAQRLGHIFPTAWAMKALHQLISFGADIPHILPELGILLLFAIASHLVANFALRYK
jgi:hypothetical protein